LLGFSCFVLGFFFFFLVLGFELRALHLQGRLLYHLSHAPSQPAPFFRDRVSLRSPSWPQLRFSCLRFLSAELTGACHPQKPILPSKPPTLPVS
jgi:hypothetical protein